MTRRTHGLTLLVVLWAALYTTHLVRHEYLPARDVGATQVPWRAVLGEQLRAGELPLWDPLSNQGRHLLANPSCQAAYPPTMLLALLRPETTVALLQALHHLVFLLGCFQLARRSGAADSAAVVAAACAGTGGIAFSVALHVNIQGALAWAPWAVSLALPRSVGRGGGTSARALGTGALVGLSFLAGEPITALLAAVSVATVVLLSWPRRRSAALALAGAAALAVALPVLLPLLAAYPETVRGTLGVAPGAIAADALAPRRWLELVFPRILGNTLATVDTGFWAAPSFPWMCYFPSVFVGSVTPILLAFAAVSRRRLRPWWILFAAGAIGAVLTGFPALGDVIERLPGARNVRFGIKFLLLATLALPPLLAAGWEELAMRWRRTGRAAVAATLSAVVLFLPAALFPEAVLRPLLATAYPASRDSLAGVPPADLRRRMFLDIASLAAPLSVALVAGPASFTVAATVGAAHMMAAGDVRLFETGAHWAIPPAVRRHLGPSPVIANFAAAASPPTSPRHRELESYWRARAALVANFGSRWEVGYVLEEGPDGLESARQVVLAAAARRMPLLERGRIARALGAEAVVADRPVPGAPAVEVDGVWLSLLEGHAPPAYMAERLLPAADPVAAAEMLAHSAFRPGLDAVVGGTGGARELGGGTVAESPGSPARRHFEVDTDGRGLLVVQQSYMRSWRATVDGLPVTPAAANWVVLGVPVPGGRHLITLELDRRPYLLGLLGPLFLALVAIALSLRARSCRAHGEPTDAAAHTGRATAPET